MPMNGTMSFWSQIWSPVVMTDAPARRRSIVILPVMPRPAAAFSPLTTLATNVEGHTTLEFDGVDDVNVVVVVVEGALGPFP